MERTLLIELRKLQFPSQEAAADFFGVSRSFWGALERGDRDPTLTLAKEVAEHFGRPIEEIFFAGDCYTLKHDPGQGGGGGTDPTQEQAPAKMP